MDLNSFDGILIYISGSGKWIQYDDDNPIPQREEDISKLSGGGKSVHDPISSSISLNKIGHHFFFTAFKSYAIVLSLNFFARFIYQVPYFFFALLVKIGDWHMAYICMYKARLAHI